MPNFLAIRLVKSCHRLNSLRMIRFLPDLSPLFQRSRRMNSSNSKRCSMSREISSPCWTGRTTRRWRSWSDSPPCLNTMSCSMMTTYTSFIRKRRLIIQRTSTRSKLWSIECTSRTVWICMGVGNRESNRSRILSLWASALSSTSTAKIKTTILSRWYRTTDLHSNARETMIDAEATHMQG